MVRTVGAIGALSVALLLAGCGAASPEPEESEETTGNSTTSSSEASDSTEADVVNETEAIEADCPTLDQWARFMQFDGAAGFTTNWVNEQIGPRLPDGGCLWIDYTWLATEASGEVGMQPWYFNIDQPGHVALSDLGASGLPVEVVEEPAALGADAPVEYTSNPAAYLDVMFTADEWATLQGILRQSVQNDSPQEASEPEGGDGSVDEAASEIIEEHLDKLRDSEIDEGSNAALREEVEERLTGNGWTLEHYGEVRIVDRPEPNYDQAVVPVTISRDGCGEFDVNILGNVPGDWRISAVPDTSIAPEEADTSQTMFIWQLDYELCGG